MATPKKTGKNSTLDHSETEVSNESVHGISKNKSFEEDDDFDLPLDDLDTFDDFDSDDDDDY